MDSDTSESDFDGFTPEELERAEQNQENVNEQSWNESDIDISDISSSEEENSESESEEEIENVRAEWRRETMPIRERVFAENTGPKHNLPVDARQLDYLFLFLPETFFETVSDETNRYAEQTIRASGRPDPIWRPTSPAEIRAYFTINIMFGIKQLPRIWNYWSPDIRYGDPYISSIMPKTRFLKLNQYIHIRDTSNAPGRNDANYDPLYKVRPMLDLLSDKYRTVYVPGKNLSVDEAMIGFKGRVHFRQYMPAKPTKWGIKVWQVCESDSGYCCGFDVYTGKKQNGERQFGLGYDVVWQLSEQYHFQNRCLFFDRFFSSVILAEHLSHVQTNVCGTIMSNRRGLPVEFKNTKLKNRGEIRQMQKGDLIATTFKDKRQIHFLSTGQQPGIGADGKPIVNTEYNKNMGGVDKCDQLCSYYPVGRPGNKWWRYIMWYLVNLSIVNAFIVFSKSEKYPPPPKHYDHLKFRVDVASQLCAGFSSRKHKAGRKASMCDLEVNKENVDLHKMDKINGRKKVCKLCSMQKRKTAKGYQVETSFMCTFCKVALCKGCFGLFHDRNLV